MLRKDTRSSGVDTVRCNVVGLAQQDQHEAASMRYKYWYPLLVLQRLKVIAVVAVLQLGVLLASPQSVEDIANHISAQDGE